MVGAFLAGRVSGVVDHGPELDGRVVGRDERGGGVELQRRRVAVKIEIQTCSVGFVREDQTRLAVALGFGWKRIAHRRPVDDPVFA